MLPKPESKGDFLKAALLVPLLKKGKASAKIVGEPTVGKFGIDVPVQIAKSAFIYTLDVRGRDYRMVTEHLGLSNDDWEGATLILGLRDGTTKDGEPTQYVNVLSVSPGA